MFEDLQSYRRRLRFYSDLDYILFMGCEVKNAGFSNLQKYLHISTVLADLFNFLSISIQFQSISHILFTIKKLAISNISSFVISHSSPLLVLQII